MARPNYATISPTGLQTEELALMAELRLVRQVMRMRQVVPYRPSKCDPRGPKITLTGIVGAPQDFMALNAIKLLHNLAGGHLMGLKDAKDIVDAVRQGGRPVADFHRILNQQEVVELRRFFVF